MLTLQILQIEEPFCCEINQLVLENAETCFGFTFSGVPTDKLEALQGRVCQVIGKLTSGERELDTARMHTIIKHQMLSILNQVSGCGKGAWLIYLAVQACSHMTDCDGHMTSRMP